MARRRRPRGRCRRGRRRAARRRARRPRRSASRRRARAARSPRSPSIEWMRKYATSTSSSAASRPAPVTASPATTGNGSVVTRSGRRANPRSSWPSRASAGTRAAPIAPLTPVTRMRIDLPSWPMHLLGELEASARELLDVAHYDYFAGGAGDEQTIAENAAAWRKLWIRPRVMVDVSTVDTSLHAARPAPRAARAARADGRPAPAASRRRARRGARGGRRRDRLLPVDAARPPTSRRSPRPPPGRCGFSSTSIAIATAPSRCSRASPSTASRRSC